MSKSKKNAYRDPAALSIYIGAKVTIPVTTERHFGTLNVQGTVEHIHKSGTWCSVRYSVPGGTLTTTLPLRPVTKRDAKGNLVTVFYPRAMQQRRSISNNAARYNPPTPFGIDVVTSNR